MAGLIPFIKTSKFLSTIFNISWNLSDSIWAIEQDSVSETGCIHTSQGLEFDYVGVIIGPDLSLKDDQVMTNYTKRAKTDQSLKAIKTMAKENPEKAHAMADQIIRNTYRTLMTRDRKDALSSVRIQN